MHDCASLPAIYITLVLLAHTVHLFRSRLLSRAKRGQRRATAVRTTALSLLGAACFRPCLQGKQARRLVPEHGPGIAIRALTRYEVELSVDTEHRTLSRLRPAQLRGMFIPLSLGASFVISAASTYHTS